MPESKLSSAMLVQIWSRMVAEFWPVLVGRVIRGKNYSQEAYLNKSLCNYAMYVS